MWLSLAGDLPEAVLREQHSSLIEERARLVEKNETARTKVEQMIIRLKSMEAGQ